MGARFVIVAAARTGSNRLVAQLQAQRDVWCHGEIHQVEHCWVRGPAGWNRTFPKIEQELLALRKSNLRAFYDSVFSLSHGREHVGFKALWKKQQPRTNEIRHSRHKHKEDRSCLTEYPRGVRVEKGSGAKWRLESGTDGQSAAPENRILER